MADLDSDLIRGNVDTIILKTLFNGDRYGYEIIKEIQDRTDGEFVIKQPTLYSCLKRLEKQGFIESYWGDESNGGRRKYFSLTSHGKEVFERYNNEWEHSKNLINALLDDKALLKTPETDDDVTAYDENYVVGKRPKKRKPRSKPTVKPETKPETHIEDVSENLSNDMETDEPIGGAMVYDEYNDDNIIRMADESTPPQNKPAVEDEIVDSHALLESLYNENAQSSKSYYEHLLTDNAKQEQDETPTRASSILYDDNNDIIDSADTSTTETQQPPQQQPQNNDLPYNIPITIEQEPLARARYKTVLEEIITHAEKKQAENAPPPPIESECEPSPLSSEKAPETEAAAAYMQNTAVEEDEEEFDEHINIREHNSSAKEYSQTYYVYSNRLMFSRYTILSILSFVFALCTSLALFLLNIRMRYDWLIYIFACLIPIAMFVTAAAIFIKDPNRKKRMSCNFKSSLIIRLVVMCQLLLIIYCINLIMGMPVSFSMAYLPSCLIPSVLTIFVPISVLVYQGLYNSGKYAVN